MQQEVMAAGALHTLDLSSQVAEEVVVVEEEAAAAAAVHQAGEAKEVEAVEVAEEAKDRVLVHHRLVEVLRRVGSEELWAGSMERALATLRATWATDL